MWTSLGGAGHNVQLTAQTEEIKMKALNKKRIENLERAQMRKKSRPKRAILVYEPSLSNFDIKALPIDAAKVLLERDNGNCCVQGEHVHKGPYRVTYSQ